jgi:uncharacterized repeat protein (TIGR02543 family)
MKSRLAILIFLLTFFFINFQKVNAAPPNISFFTNSGIVFNRHGASGPYEDFYEVDSVEKLYMIRYFKNSGFILVNDINFSNSNDYINSGIIGDFNDDGTEGNIYDELTQGLGWLPIDNSYNLQNINGNGHIIENLYINRTTRYVGFFKMIGGPIGTYPNLITIENLTFSGVNITTNKGDVGIIAAESRGNILLKDTYVINASITSTYSSSCSAAEGANIGGLIGTIYREATANINIFNVGVNATINAKNCSVGGIVGSVGSKSINVSNAYFTGSIQGNNNGSNFGGLIGDIIESDANVSISDSFVYGVISSDSSYGPGGLIGGAIPGSGLSDGQTFHINNVYSAGYIQSRNRSGGMFALGSNSGQYFSNNPSSVLENSFAAMVMDKYPDSFDSLYRGKSFVTGADDFDYDSPATIDNFYIASDVGLINTRTLAGRKEDQLVTSGIILETTSSSYFSKNWQENVLLKDSNSWTLSISSGDTLAALPILLQSGTSVPLLYQPFITSSSLPRLIGESGLVNFNSFITTYTLMLNGGVGSSTFVSGSGQPISIPSPSRNGFEFVGWFEDAGFTVPFTDSFMTSSSKTLYAQWRPTTFTITLDSVGGSAVGPVSGNEGDVVSLPVPTLKDYRFDGWLDSQGQLVNDPYTIKNVNETFTAKWTFVTFSPVRVIPLERTYHLEVEEAVELELGTEFDVPSFEAYELYGRVTTDLSDYVTITGEINDAPGEYPITYTLSYNDIVLTETVMVTVVDTIPPELTIEMPSSIFFKGEFTPLISASDNAPGDVTITRVKEVDVNRPGIQLFIVDAEDASGNVTRLIKEVSVVMPEVRYEAVMVNAQRLMFVVYENLMDFTTMILYMAQSIVEPAMTSNEWEVYEERDFVATGPGERIYLQLRDALGNVLSRESIELFWREPVDFTPTRTRGEVVYPEIEPRYYIPWPLVGGISIGGISLSGISWWFIKRRKKNTN